ncbi:MAG: cyclic pyranopterin monophosphate synthase MoaC [Verrucomicrobiae bacterium]|nr:cyclic pyranopterin monophosphate synthase MoaC [Verrucomicrobiae bacterium]
MLTHLNAKGEARMVDVSAKAVEKRTAVAEGFIRLQPATLRLIRADRVSKGNVLAVAQIAGIQAAKKTADLIPLCHPLALTSVALDFVFVQRPKSGLRLRATAQIAARTGVEMEALTAVSVAALAIYDMCKAVDKTMAITDVRLVSKTKRPA